MEISICFFSLLTRVLCSALCSGILLSSLLPVWLAGQPHPKSHTRTSAPNVISAFVLAENIYCTETTTAKNGPIFVRLCFCPASGKRRQTASVSCPLGLLPLATPTSIVRPVTTVRASIFVAAIQTQKKNLPKVRYTCSISTAANRAELAQSLPESAYA